MFGGLSKLNVVAGEYVTWDGNQIGIFEDPSTILLATTDEDFENGEFSSQEKRDVLNNLSTIEAALKTSFNVHH